MTRRLLRYFLACAAGGSLMGVLFGIVTRSVLPAGSVLPWVVLSTAADERPSFKGE